MIASVPRATPTPSPTPTVTPTRSWGFTDVTEQAGLLYEDPEALGGTVAAADYDGDGWTDLYLIRHTDFVHANPLFRNRGDGTFEDVSDAAGLGNAGWIFFEPGLAAFADFDGDGWLDLMTGGCSGRAGSSPQVFRNHGDGTFDDVTARTGIVVEGEYCFGSSAAFGDYDRDGYLDLFLTHWGSPVSDDHANENLWHNNGDGT